MNRIKASLKATCDWLCALGGGAVGEGGGGGGQSRGGSFTVVSPRRATLSIYSSSRRRKRKRKRKRKKRGDERITKFEAAGRHIMDRCAMKLLQCSCALSLPPLNISTPKHRRLSKKKMRAELQSLAGCST
ncbi:uncharacterized protein LOC144382980 [Gasterosteus aculeatus]